MEFQFVRTELLNQISHSLSHLRTECSPVCPPRIVSWKQAGVSSCFTWNLSSKICPTAWQPDAESTGIAGGFFGCEILLWNQPTIPLLLVESLSNLKGQKTQSVNSVISFVTMLQKESWSKKRNKHLIWYAVSFFTWIQTRATQYQLALRHLRNGQTKVPSFPIPPSEVMRLVQTRIFFVHNLRIVNRIFFLECSDEVGAPTLGTSLDSQKANWLPQVSFWRTKKTATKIKSDQRHRSSVESCTQNHEAPDFVSGGDPEEEGSWWGSGRTLRRGPTPGIPAGDFVGTLQAEVGIHQSGISGIVHSPGAGDTNRCAGRWKTRREAGGYSQAWYCVGTGNLFRIPRRNLQRSRRTLSLFPKK